MQAPHGLSLIHISKQAAEALGFKLIADDCNYDQAEQVSDVDSMISVSYTHLTAPAPPRPPCHKAGSSNRQENSPTGWDPGPGQRMWIGYACLFIFKMCMNCKPYPLAYVHLLGT